MAVGVLAGAIGTGAASASAGTHLCVDDGSVPYCAWDDPGVQFGVSMDPSNASEWTYPTTPNVSSSGYTSGSVDPIQEAGIDECLQLDHADYNVVILAACNGDDAEKWVNYYNSNSKRTEFQSYWEANDDPDGSVSVCLSFDLTGSDVPNANTGLFLKADDCEPPTGTTNWYQQFGRS